MSEVQRYRDVLIKIANWNECSTEFRIDYGSNGERDYYRNLASSALEEIPEESEDTFVISSDQLKEFTTSFFYWWWNNPTGTNTKQAFDEWFRSPEVKKILFTL